MVPVVARAPDQDDARLAGRVGSDQDEDGGGPRTGHALGGSLPRLPVDADRMSASGGAGSSLGSDASRATASAYRSLGRP